MKIIIHRGSQEIGGSCVEIQTTNNKILINYYLICLPKGDNIIQM